MAIGLYRIKDSWGNEDSVRVHYTIDKELEIPVSKYRADGYDPPFEELPWSNDIA